MLFLLLFCNGVIKGACPHIEIWTTLNFTMSKKVDKVQLCETQIVRVGHQSLGILADYPAIRHSTGVRNQNKNKMSWAINMTDHGDNCERHPAKNAMHLEEDPLDLELQLQYLWLELHLPISIHSILISLLPPRKCLC